MGPLGAPLLYDRTVRSNHEGRDRFRKSEPGETDLCGYWEGSASLSFDDGFCAPGGGRNLPYAIPGDAQGLMALLGGHVMMQGTTFPPIIPQERAGKVRSLAVIEGRERLRGILNCQPSTNVA